MTIKKYDWVSKDTKRNANGWSVPLRWKVFLYKVTSPTTGLACIIQHFYLFLQICVMCAVNFGNTVTCMQKMNRKTFPFLLNRCRVTIT